MARPIKEKTLIDNMAQMIINDIKTLQGCILKDPEEAARH